MSCTFVVLLPFLLFASWSRSLLELGLNSLYAAAERTGLFHLAELVSALIWPRLGHLRLDRSYFSGDVLAAFLDFIR